jgi:outer membrane protein TolC
LYQAGNVKRQVAVAKIQVKSAEYNLEKVKLQTANQVQTALSDFENQQLLLTLEKENTLLAKENLEISLARLRLGQTNSLEARQAETSYQSALARLSNFQFNLKAAETKLRQLLAAL